MEIIQDLIPKGRNNRPGYSMNPSYITVHNTANTSRGANALMHARYVKNPTTAASWHFTVDDGNKVYQHLPTNENGWHAGDGNGPGNRQSIGIEICENVDGNFNKAMDNAIWLIKRLMKTFDIPLKNVVPHQRWSGKYCPHKILPIWSDFINKIHNVSPVNGTLKNPPPPAKPTAKPPTKPVTNSTTKSTTPTSTSLVDWLKANKMDSSFANRAKLAKQYGLTNYTGTANQNITLLNKLKNTSTQKKSTKQTVHLPASAKTWRTYKLNVKPVTKNSDWSLTPSEFGGLTYEILDKPYPNVVTINTSRGKRNIYVGKETGAVIK